MNVKVEYKHAEIEKMVLAAHEKQFGTAPAGDMWTCRESYGTYVVENCEIEQPIAKKQEVEA